MPRKGERLGPRPWMWWRGRGRPGSFAAVGSLEAGKARQGGGRKWRPVISLPSRRSDSRGGFGGARAREQTEWGEGGELLLVLSGRQSVELLEFYFKKANATVLGVVFL
jgi:hypothetical protein